MKRSLCLMLTALLLASAAYTALAEGAQPFEFADAIPEEYWRSGDETGLLTRITYDSKDYAGDGADIVKHALVYLPHGYDREGCYDVLILMHGVGGTEEEWGFGKAYRSVKNVVDHLIANGEIRPLLIVMPNGRATANCYDTSMNNAGSFYAFGQELRNDLLPYIDSHYPTYGALTPDDPSAAREHRIMAGLSMGGMQTINIGLCECLDLFATFGAFSAAPSSYTAEQIAQRIDEQFPGMRINYYYSICGLQDSLYQFGSAAAREMLGASDRFDESNWHWQERDGGHDFGIWNLGLYNLLRVYAATHTDP